MVDGVFDSKPLQAIEDVPQHPQAGAQPRQAQVSDTLLVSDMLLVSFIVSAINTYTVSSCICCALYLWRIGNLKSQLVYTNT